MAFLAQLTAQTEELLTAITGASSKNDPQAFGALREATLRSLRHHNSLRTNQFEVESRLDGLEERFSVAGRDGLADALRERRYLLAEHTATWTPDVLHFLLELSDRPTEDASLDALEALCTSRYPPEPPPLRWEDISREDDWASEPNLWQSTDYGDTSGDDYDRGDDRDDWGGSSDGTTISSIGAHDQESQTSRDLVADEHTREELAALLAAVRESQAWRFTQPMLNSGDGKVPVSELQIVRETLFMLQGLETTLFGTDCVPVTAYRLSNVSLQAHRSLLGSVAVSGRKLIPLRRRASRSRRENDVPLLQVFQEAIRHRLQTFDYELSALQARFVDIQGDVPVSLVAVMDELQPSLLCLFALSAVVKKLESERNAHAFRYLEILFDATSIAQFEGEPALYAYLGTIFFDCFRVYLRPIRTWMEDGKLLEGDKVFFVAGAPAQVPLNQIWQHQYKLLRTKSGALHAPRFLQPAASKIFTTGKSIVVLRHLGKYDNTRASGRTAVGPDAPETVEPTLDFATVCPPGVEMAPFAQLFGNAFGQWIQSKHHAASATLQTTLFDACGLWASLEALHCVYLMADGAAVDAFASRVFHSLDTMNPRWHDRYTMTELAREAFSERLDGYRLSVTMDKGTTRDNDAPAVARRSLRSGLARIRLTYRLAWPVQIIIPAEGIASYQAMFTLLLQVRRASGLLSRHRLLDDGNDVRASLGGGATEKTERSRLPAGDRALYFTLRAKLLWFCNTLQSYLATLVIAPRIDALRVDLQKAVEVDAMISVHAQFLKALVEESCLGAKVQPIRDGMLDLLDLALRLEDAHRANSVREASELQETWRLSLLSSPYQTPSKKFAAGSPANASGADSVRRNLFFATPQRRLDSQDGEEGGEYEIGEGDDNDHDYDDDDGHDGHDRYGGEDDQDDGYDLTISPATKADRTKRASATTTAKRRDRQQVAAAKQSYSEVLQSIGTDFSNSLRFITGGLRAVARASSDATTAVKWDMLAEMLDDGSEREGVNRY